MSRPLISLADKLKLLFENIKHEDGTKFTYEYIKNLTDIDPSTISRIRSGQNQDPTFTNIMRLANAFAVSLDYFAVDMTADEALTYIQQHRNSKSDDTYFEQLKADAQQRSTDRVESLALRASHLDSEALDAVEMMVNYVLKQKGLSIETDAMADEGSTSKDSQRKVDMATPNLRDI